jgi:hypothetical protein
MFQTILDAITPPPAYHMEACWLGTVVLTFASILMIIRVPHWLYSVLSETVHTAFWSVVRIVQACFVLSLITAVGLALKVHMILRVALLVGYIAQVPYNLAQGSLALTKIFSHDTRLALQFAVLPRALDTAWYLPNPQRRALLEVWADLLADSLRGWKLPEIQAVLARIEAYRASHKEQAQLALLEDIYNRVGSCSTFASANWDGLDRVRDSLCPAK